MALLGYKYICMYVYMYVHMYVCVYMYVYVCVFIVHFMYFNSLSLAVNSLDMKEASLAASLEQQRHQLNSVEKEISKIAVHHANLTK